MSFEYRDLRPVERARLANTDPARYRAEKQAWERAGRPGPRPITSASLVRAGLAHNGKAYRDMSWTERERFSRENPARYAELRDQWIAAGRPEPETDGPEAA